ncbi:MAG: hypothetical protein ABL995_12085 [Bryobacteraceae bacterium]
MVRFCRERISYDFEQNSQNNNKQSRGNSGQKKKTEEEVVEEKSGQEIEDRGQEKEAAEEKPVAKSPAVRTQRRASAADGEKPDARAQVVLVNKLLKKLELKLTKEDLKASMGDFIRLMQLQRELEDEAPREIKVTWVEPKDEAERVENGG